MHGLKDFIRNYRVCNMHVERLLALFKKSVVEATPDVTKFACNGYVSQQMHEHIAAGGCDPRHNERRDELLAKGVPLQAQNRQKKMDTDHKCNGLFSYLAHRCFEVPLSQRTPEQRSCFAKEFGKLDENARRLWAEMEARKKDAPLELCGETQDERYSRNIGDRLWGQSCRQQPVNISSLEMAMANPTTGNIGGIVETPARFRDTLGKNLFIEDKGESRICVCSCCLICSCVLVRV